jgi:hypothetical protein
MHPSTKPEKKKTREEKRHVSVGCQEGNLKNCQEIA